MAIRTADENFPYYIMKSTTCVVQLQKISCRQMRSLVSNIFTRPKSDGRIRIILNLKQFNKQYVEKVHFKMETLQSAITAMRQNCYFGSIDISDPYYTIPIDENDRRLFRFEFKGTKYQFTS